MIMTVASGTSTPTSTTVVETRIGFASGANSARTADLSAGGMRPWRIPIPTRGSTAAIRSAVSRVAATSRSRSSIAGTTT